MKRPFADGEYEFKLGFEEAAEFERLGKRSLFQTLIRMTQEGHWSVTDTADIIRLGLIGGGLAAPEALKVVEFYVKRSPLADNTKLVIDILEEAFFGAEESKPEPELAAA